MSRPSHNDEGVSLIELIVAIVVSGLFAGMVTLMFVNGWAVQDRSLSRDSATAQANLVKATMASALRTATAVRVSSGGMRLDAQVAMPNASYDGMWEWECRAWVLTDDSIRYSVGATIRDGDPAEWPVLAGKSPQRERDAVAGTIGAGASAPFVLVESKGVQIGLNITAVGDDSVTIAVSDGMTAQAVAPTAALAGATECWH